MAKVVQNSVLSRYRNSGDVKTSALNVRESAILGVSCWWATTKWVWGDSFVGDKEVGVRLRTPSRTPLGKRRKSGRFPFMDTQTMQRKNSQDAQ